MSKKIIFLLGLAMSLLVSSCSTLERKTSGIDIQQHQQHLSSLSDWQMKGRMVVVNGAELWAMSVDWEQHDDQYVIFLSGPFGSGKIQLAGSANGVLLKDSDNQIFYATTPEELLLEHTGIAMPLTSLRFWMIGLLQPNTNAVNIKFDEYGRLESLTREQWDVDFKRYTKNKNAVVELPDKIFIHQGDDVKVRVVVGEWLIDKI